MKITDYYAQSKNEITRQQHCCISKQDWILVNNDKIWLIGCPLIEQFDKRFVLFLYESTFVQYYEVNALKVCGIVLFREKALKFVPDNLLSQREECVFALHILFKYNFTVWKNFERRFPANSNAMQT